MWDLPGTRNWTYVPALTGEFFTSETPGKPLSSFFNFYWSIVDFTGSLGGSVVENPPAILEMQKTQVQSLGWENPLEEEMATHSITLMGIILRQRSLVDYSPWGHKESDVTER